MSPPSSSTRHRLINAALSLFAAQGVTETTTRQIAEMAGVNEVTLFRQFGNKHGLLFAVIEEADAFSSLTEAWVAQVGQVSSPEEALKDYAESRLEALASIPALVRSLVGEAGQYPTENREALGREITQANQIVAEYLQTALDREQLKPLLAPKKIASLLNSLLLGYTILELTSEDQLWDHRQDFLEHLVALFLGGAVIPRPDSGLRSTPSLQLSTPENQVADLPAATVHRILQQAKQLSLPAYALMYVLFGAGLKPAEVAGLRKEHHLSDRHQHLLQVTQGSVRRVPVNQWIMGKRYGSYRHNPLTQWLKSRKDDQPALFITETKQPMTVPEIQSCWQTCTQGFLNPEGTPIVIEQAQQTWGVEMLVKGVSIEDLSLLTGLSPEALTPYAQRAQERLALEQAIRLDQKLGKGASSAKQ